MENQTFSIIVPVYNVEQYLENCINSVLNQSFRNFQLILVDDGSKDRSADIIKYYEKNQLLEVKNSDFFKILPDDYIIYESLSADGTKILQNHIANSTLFLYYLLLENNVEQEGYKRHFSILTKNTL